MEPASRGKAVSRINSPLLPVRRPSFSRAGGAARGPRRPKKVIRKAEPVLSEEDVRVLAEGAERGLRVS